MNNQIIIIGGGKSISEGISLGLKEKIKNTFTIACNYAYRHFDATLLCCTDYPEFYMKLPELENLPLIIATDNCIERKIAYANTFFLKDYPSYTHEILTKGVYRANLTGIFALSIAQWLLDYSGTIMLLGFDWSISTNQKSLKKTENAYDTKVETHYYSKEEIPHRGQNFVGYYSYHNPDYYFKHFKEPNIKIYNVSPESTILNFEKINYVQMFGLLSTGVHNQEELRNKIKEKLCLK